MIGHTNAIYFKVGITNMFSLKLCDIDGAKYLKHFLRLKSYYLHMHDTIFHNGNYICHKQDIIF